MEEDIHTESLRGMEKLLELKKGGERYFVQMIWTPKFDGM